MDRRTFLGALGVALLATPLATEAQVRHPNRVAFLTLNPGFSAAAAMFDALRQGFKDLGYREGDNLMLEYRFANGNRDLLPALVLELLTLQPAVIVTFGTPATAAARNAAPTVPIVFVGVADPVGSGFAESLARPAGKLTGSPSLGRSWPQRIWSSSRLPSQKLRLSPSWEREIRTSHWQGLYGPRLSRPLAPST
jgi:putative ABC transport system substrate-binding protein